MKNPCCYLQWGYKKSANGGGLTLLNTELTTRCSNLEFWTFIPNIMTKQESLRRKIIELIHGMPYEEAVKRENNSLYCNHCNRKDNFRMSENRTSFFVYCANCEYKTEYAERQRHPGQRDEELAKIGHRKPLPITLGRLMKALSNSKESFTVENMLTEKRDYVVISVEREGKVPVVFKWLTTLQGGSEANLDNQLPETKEALYNLLCR